MILLTRDDALIWLDDHAEWMPRDGSAFEVEREARKGWSTTFEQDALLALLEWVSVRVSVK